jgi:hypothetical protein
MEFSCPEPEKRRITFSADAGEGELLLTRLIERWTERMKNHD